MKLTAKIQRGRAATKTERECPHPQQATDSRALFEIFKGAGLVDVAASEDTRALSPQGNLRGVRMILTHCTAEDAKSK